MHDGQISMEDIQAAVLVKLQADSTFLRLCTGGGPYDPAPPDTPFPYVTFGEHVETPLAAFQGVGASVLFLLHVWSQRTTFQEALAIANACIGALHGKVLPLGNGWQHVGFLFDWSTKVDDPDGVTRHVPLRFQTWAVLSPS